MVRLGPAIHTQATACVWILGASPRMTGGGGVRCRLIAPLSARIRPRTSAIHGTRVLGYLAPAITQLRCLPGVAWKALGRSGLVSGASIRFLLRPAFQVQTAKAKQAECQHWQGCGQGNCRDVGAVGGVDPLEVRVGGSCEAGSAAYFVG